ncbi:MAG: GPP34 family phosphoprotein [Flavobacteriaceae bacterium]|nr:GPP34 family phosphoprotein [Flavobacteriaceae bacterium]
MELNILSKFLLIAHHPQKSCFLTSSIHIGYGIIGAALLEMSLQGHLKIENKKVVLAKPINSDITIINEISKEIIASKKLRTISYWLSVLNAKGSKYKWEILSDLSKHKLLRIENKKFLGFIKYKKTYLTGDSTRDNLINQLNKQAIYASDLNNESLILLGLVEACQMHKIIASDKNQLKKLRKDLKIIIKKSTVTDLFDQIIKQIQVSVIIIIT